MAPIKTRQALVPGIPDDLTMTCIAPKLNWETCNVLQMVSRKWKRVIRNRNVYNARVHSKSTEPYLVLLSRTRWDVDMFPILFSCKEESHLLLPPIATANPEWFDCICLDGRIYLWIKTKYEDSVPEFNSRRWSEICLWVLDLAGDRKWTRHDQGKYPTSETRFHYGVLDGAFYKFQGTSHPCHGVLNEGPFGTSCSEERRMDDHTYRKYFRPPETEVYDPLSHEWSFVTPETPSGSISLDLDGELAFISKWAREELGEEHLTYGRYEPYFSEWRRSQLGDCPTSSSITIGCQDAMACQVYYTNEEAPNELSILKGLSRSVSEETIFFLAKKLLKCGKRSSWETYMGFREMCGMGRHRMDEFIIHMEMYNAYKNTWEHWKSFSTGSRFLDGAVSSCSIADIVSVDNVIWAYMNVINRHAGNKGAGNRGSLVRTPVLLTGDNDERVTWIDTGYSLDDSGQLVHFVKLRPIFL